MNCPKATPATPSSPPPPAPPTRPAILDAHRRRSRTRRYHRDQPPARRNLTQRPGSGARTPPGQWQSRGRRRRRSCKQDEAETSSGLLRISPAADGSSSACPLSGATATIDIARDATAIANLTLHPLTREVLIIGLLQGLDPAAVSTLQATLYGLSNERGIDQPFAGTTTAASSASSDAAVSGAAAGNTVSYHLSAPFTLSADGTFSLAFRLLGTDPATSQRLRLTLTYRDPAAAPYIYEADVTPLLTGFNTGPAQQPAQLNATLSFGIDGISTTITSWTPGVDEDITGQ
ncbi:MAG: hypothetical protein V8Q76_07165 [Bacteroides intestinalis]